MEEKVEVKKELVAMSKEFASKKLKELVEKPENKAILDEYFTWVNVLNSPVNIVDVPEEDTKTKEIPSKPLKKVK